jgi:hypothetical protein
MTLLALVIGMFIAVYIGKKEKEFGKKQYVAAAILAFIQTGIVVYHMLTMKKPPLF